MLQELSDQDLAMVNGGAGNTGTNVTMNQNITIVENKISIVYAPVYVINSTVAYSNIDNGNVYVQNSKIH